METKTFKIFERIVSLIASIGSIIGLILAFVKDVQFPSMGYTTVKIFLFVLAIGLIFLFIYILDIFLI